MTTDVTSTALLTDRYELTMLDAALQAGTADAPATFEVFTRRLPPGRRFGVFAGLGRLLDALESFCFGPDELEWLANTGVVTPATLDWLAGFSFAGDVHAYPEGELYTDGSPVLTVEAPVRPGRAARDDRAVDPQPRLGGGGGRLADRPGGRRPAGHRDGQPADRR